MSPEQRPQQRPLELILARNLLSSLATPGFLVGEQGTLVYYNEAAGALIGRAFEETGMLSAPEWTQHFGPVDEHGESIAYDQIAATVALRAEQRHRRAARGAAVPRQLVYPPRRRAASADSGERHTHRRTWRIQRRDRNLLAA